MAQFCATAIRLHALMCKLVETIFPGKLLTFESELSVFFMDITPVGSLINP